MRGIDRWIHDLNKNDLAHLGEALEIAENDGQKALEQAREEHAAAVASALLRQKTELEGTAQQQQQQQVANTQRATEQQVQQELAQQFQQQLQQKEQQFQQQLQQQEQGLMRRISELEASSASAAAAQERHMESLQAENHQLLEKVASLTGDLVTSARRQATVEAEAAQAVTRAVVSFLPSRVPLFSRFLVPSFRATERECLSKERTFHRCLS